MIRSRIAQYPMAAALWLGVAAGAMAAPCQPMNDVQGVLPCLWAEADRTPDIAFTTSFVPADAGRDGGNLGLRQCRRFNVDGYYRACIEIAFDATFDAGAMRQCQRFNQNDYLLECVRATANRSYETGVLKQCDRFTDNGYLLRCLQTAADRRFESGILKQCDRFSENRFLSRCLELAADRHFDERRLDLCDGFGTNEGLLGCLGDAER